MTATTEPLAEQPAMFQRWAMLKGRSSLPAAPISVAGFISDCADLGAEAVWKEVAEISRAHVRLGLADPTLGGAAATAMNVLSKVVAPRSWPKEQKERFFALPYDLQLFMVAREAQRDKAVRQAQNAAVATRGKSKV